MTKQKILFFDIETSPILGWAWGTWEQNMIRKERDWVIMSFSYKFQGGKVHTKCLADYGTKIDDSQIIKDLWKVLDEADIVVAHNGAKFDIKKTNAKLIKNGIKPYSPFKVIDTLKVARKHFKFDSNRLDDLGEYLGVGRKFKHEGIDLWFKCLAGDKKAWASMKKYNAQDVVLLEKVYDKMLGWMDTHPGVSEGCNNCGFGNLVKSKLRMTRTGLKQQWQCKDCGAYKTTTCTKKHAR